MVPRPLRYPAKAIWNNTTTWQKFDISGAMSTDSVVNVRPIIEVTNLVGTNVQIEVYYESSDDGTTWTDHGKLGTYTTITADGTIVNSGYTDISSNVQGKIFWRIGARIQNSSGSVHGAAYVAVSVDFKA